ncbi:MAG TPA: hypothetical protein VE650_02010 [Acetobacteraceae bacterium]|nr:hypothetical protein [Acetobacteraceae bacterium]
MSVHAGRELRAIEGCSPQAKTVEALARRLCKRDQLDPDLAVGAGEPSRVWTPDGVLFVALKTFPLWQAYVGLAEEILAGAFP